MKWKEFKDAVEAEGVTDDIEIDWIDIGSSLPIEIWWPDEKPNPVTKIIPVRDHVSISN